MSSYRSEHSSPRRPTPVAVPTTPPPKPEGPSQPVDTSSQMSTEVAEASLEDIPASISPIAAISRTGSVTPPVDKLELQANANKALGDFLTTKASIDAHRWRAMWELSIALCQSKSQAAEPIKEAKAACSQVTQHPDHLLPVNLRSQDQLLLGNLRSQDHLLNCGQESQDNQRPYGPRS